MSPAELAEKHPRLYHLTDPLALPGIRRLGLLPTSELLGVFEVPAGERVAIERRRRPGTVRIEHPRHGAALITDNLPLSEKALRSCLDDGLDPEDWLLMLNARVFFWPAEDELVNHLSARFNRGRERLVLVFDTLKLATHFADRVELSAINTGSTIRKPARRGLATFTPMSSHSYRDWRRLRGGTDDLKEVTVRGGVRDVDAVLLETYLASERHRQHRWPHLGQVRLL